MGVIDERDFAGFEFKVGFLGISYIASDTRDSIQYKDAILPVL